MPEHSARADDPLVIVGASLSGVRAAEGARAQGWTGRIVMVGEEPHLPYDRPPLSKALLDAETEPALPLLRQAEGWEALDVELMTSTAATAVDVDRKILLTTSEPIGYRALVIATGHRARSLDELAGFDNVHTLRHFDDALVIRETLCTATRLLVIGTGFIGSEIASAAAARGIDVTLIGTTTHPLGRGIGPVAGAMLAALHDDAGVTLLSGSGLSDVTSRDNRIGSVRTSCGREFLVDAVVVGIGSSPATEWLSTSRITLDASSRGVVCDPTMATSAPAVWGGRRRRRRLGRGRCPLDVGCRPGVHSRVERCWRTTEVLRSAVRVVVVARPPYPTGRYDDHRRTGNDQRDRRRWRGALQRWRACGRSGGNRRPGADRQNPSHAVGRARCHGRLTRRPCRSRMTQVGGGQRVARHHPRPVYTGLTP